MGKGRFVKLRHISYLVQISLPAFHSRERARARERGERETATETVREKRLPVCVCVWCELDGVVQLGSI